MAAAFNDMTDRIRDMLHTKDQLLMDISHELRTPLTRMKVALEFLTESQAKENLHGDIADMEKMVTEILETARLHHKYTDLKKQPTNLIALLKQTLKTFENQTPGIKVVDLPSEIDVRVVFKCPAI
jgi:signal transduction histidine kinase